MKTEEKLRIIDEAILKAEKASLGGCNCFFLCLDTHVCDIPQVSKWIKMYQDHQDHQAFTHNPFTGEKIVDQPIIYAAHKLAILLEIRKRIKNKKALTIHPSLLRCTSEQN